ncbi:MAG: TIGR00282 family metallophosphoesterase [Alphaproteobacteria bacterium]|nr:TIGR00282 family metallophosphoesterase [Alphaproteobacteria bacterium]
MKILCLGDVFGRPGREAIFRDLPGIKKKHKIDFVIANVENSAHGFGVTEKICNQFLTEANIDVLTIGDHAISRKDTPVDLPHVVSAGNYQDGAYGKGYTILKYKNKRIAALCLLGKVFVENTKKTIDNPFAKFDEIYKKIQRKSDLIFLDFHAEATGEKQAMGYHVDGKITGLFGTHTHVPTSDARILSKGTGYITDIGMCGNYDSVIGADPERALTHHLPETKRTHLQPQMGEGQLSGVIFIVDDKTDVCVEIKPLLPKLKTKI